MYEIMIDLETLDTRPSAIVLSIGAVVWKTVFNPAKNELEYEIAEHFLRIPAIQPQTMALRTMSESTLLWWQQQNSTAKAEAFAPVRHSMDVALADLTDFVKKWTELGVDGHRVNHFWASPSTFDFPIIESLIENFGHEIPWSYRQKYDVRTVVNEAAYSAKDHDYNHIPGVAHTPVYDCVAQVDLLTAARNRIFRRING
jgi:hypothetical protein